MLLLLLLLLVTVHYAEGERLCAMYVYFHCILKSAKTMYECDVRILIIYFLAPSQSIKSDASDYHLAGTRFTSVCARIKMENVENMCACKRRR